MRAALLAAGLVARDAPRALLAFVPGGTRELAAAIALGEAWLAATEAGEPFEAPDAAFGGLHAAQLVELLDTADPPTTARMTRIVCMTGAALTSAEGMKRTVRAGLSAWALRAPDPG